MFAIGPADNRAWLGQTEATAFAGDWFARSAQLMPTQAPVARGCTTIIAARPFDHSAALKCATAVEVAIVRAAQPDVAHQIILGTVVAQVTYNAAVLRSQDDAAAYLRALGRFAELDSALPEFARLRATAAKIGTKDWAAQFKLGDALVAAIAAGTTPN